MAKKSKPKTDEEKLRLLELEEEEEIDELDDEPFDTVLTILPEINEEKHNTFLRLAKPRTQKVVNSLKILGNCSNKSSYDYSHLEIIKMFDYIKKALEETENKFLAKTKEQKELFEF